MRSPARRHAETAPQQLVAEELRSRVIPWGRAKTLQTTLAQPPLRASAELPVLSIPTPLLKGKPRRRMKQQTLPPHLAAEWPEQKVAANPYLSFCCVLEGTADMRVGITEAMAAANHGIEPGQGCQVVRIKAQAVCVFPPHVPYSDGGGPHWESELWGDKGAVAAYSRLLWVNVLPEGLVLHICTTNGALHKAGARVFVIDAGFHNTATAFLNALRKGHAGDLEIADLYLLILLLQAEKNLAAHNFMPDTSRGETGEAQRQDNLGLGAGIDSALDAVQRACAFIDEHLTQKLSAERIASQAFVSVSHLNRLFQAELKSSVMNYVAARRIELASSLLTSTSLPVAAIAHHLGYRHATHFSRVFIRHAGASPVQFRREQKQKAGPPRKTAARSG